VTTPSSTCHPTLCSRPKYSNPVGFVRFIEKWVDKLIRADFHPQNLKLKIFSSMSDPSSLASLESLPYIDDRGQLPEQFQGKVGVYAIFDQPQVLQYIGYSRDIYLSLKQHLVRQPQSCYWLKVQTIDRPSRTLLESIRDAWIAENGVVPAGNDTAETVWNQPIDVKAVMTPEEQQRYGAAIDEMEQIKVLKQAARRVEAVVLATLQARGVKAEIRFNPKLKETGLLDLK